MAAKDGRAGDPRRWFQGRDCRALEVWVRGESEALLGFPLGAGRRLVALERWDRDGAVARGVDLIPLLSLEQVRAGGERARSLQGRAQLELERAFFDGPGRLHGLDLGSRRAALAGLASKGIEVTLRLDRAAGGAVRSGVVLHPGPGWVVLETRAENSRGLCLLRLSHVSRIGLGAKAEWAAGPKALPRSSALAGLLRAAEPHWRAERAGRGARTLLEPLVGYSLEVELSAPQRIVQGTLVGLGGEWFALDLWDARGIGHGAVCFALDDLEALRLLDEPSGAKGRAGPTPLPDLDSLPRALVEAQRLWGGVVLELLSEDAGILLCEVREVGERGAVVSVAPGRGSAAEELWVDLAAVLSFAMPNGGEAARLSAVRAARP